MGRHSNEPTMVGTSIALLQERFRRLQKDKQRREKKELLNLLSDSNRVDGSSTSRDLDSDSLSLGLNLQNAGEQVHIHEARLMPGVTKFWPGNSVTTSTLRSFDSPDVDTTLHL